MAVSVRDCECVHVWKSSVCMCLVYVRVMLGAYVCVVLGGWQLSLLLNKGTRKIASC